jgi:hypothetical protein
MHGSHAETCDPFEFDGHVSVDRGGQPHWLKTLGWLSMLALAVLLFELTSNPALAVAVGCLKFGAGDLRVAVWLRRTDPDRGRGRACSWFYLTRAILRIGFVAWAIIMVLLCVSGSGAPRGEIERQLIGAVLLIFACFAAAALASWMALASALCRGVRVWMDATAKGAQEAGIWPPFLPSGSRRANLGPGLVVAYGTLSASIALVVVLGVALFVVMAAFRVVWNPLILLPLGIGGLALIIGALRLMTRIARRIEAATPWDCYFEPRFGPGFQVAPDPSLSA